jgi:hypothetical protein
MDSLPGTVRANNEAVIREWREACYTVTYYRAGKEKGYCILWASTGKAAVQRAKREFLHPQRGDTFKVQEG